MPGSAAKRRAARSLLVEDLRHEGDGEDERRAEKRGGGDGAAPAIRRHSCFRDGGALFAQVVRVGVRVHRHGGLLPARFDRRGLVRRIPSAAIVSPARRPPRAVSGCGRDRRALAFPPAPDSAAFPSPFRRGAEFGYHRRLEKSPEGGPGRSGPSPPIPAGGRARAQGGTKERAT